MTELGPLVDLCVWLGWYSVGVVTSIIWLRLEKRSWVYAFGWPVILAAFLFFTIKFYFQTWVRGEDV